MNAKELIQKVGKKILGDYVYYYLKKKQYYKECEIVAFTYHTKESIFELTLETKDNKFFFTHVSENDFSKLLSNELLTIKQ